MATRVVNIEGRGSSGIGEAIGYFLKSAKEKREEEKQKAREEMLLRTLSSMGDPAALEELPWLSDPGLITRRASEAGLDMSEALSLQKYAEGLRSDTIISQELFNQDGDIDPEAFARDLANRRRVPVKDVFDATVKFSDEKRKKRQSELAEAAETRAQRDQEFDEEDQVFARRDQELQEEAAKREKERLAMAWEDQAFDRENQGFARRDQQLQEEAAAREEERLGMSREDQQFARENAARAAEQEARAATAAETEDYKVWDPETKESTTFEGPPNMTPSDAEEYFKGFGYTTRPQKSVSATSESETEQTISATLRGEGLDESSQEYKDNARLYLNNSARREEDIDFIFQNPDVSAPGLYAEYSQELSGLAKDLYRQKVIHEGEPTSMQTAKEAARDAVLSLEWVPDEVNTLELPEQIEWLRGQGLSDNDIREAMKKQGLSSRDINTALTEDPVEEEEDESWWERNF